MPRPLLRLVAVLVALAGLASACTIDGDSVNQWDVNVFPVAVEWQLGDQLAAELASSVTPVEDPEVQRYVQELGDGLVAQTELADRPWHFTVIEDPTVNAFAIPGGRVYVNEGLLRAVVTEDQLLGVLAHEVSHGEARHATEQLTKQYGLVVGASILLGNDPGLIEEIAADILTAGARAKFSRDDEREADRLGVQTLIEAGHGPMGLVDFFELLLTERSRRPSSVEQFFSTHPLTEDRIGDVLERIPAGERRADDEATDSSRLARIQARLTAG